MEIDFSKLIYTNRGYYSPNMKVVPHSHNLYEFFFLEDGSINYSIDGQQYVLQKHDAVLIKKNVVHSASGITDEAASRTAIHFSESFLQFFNFDNDLNLLDCFFSKKPVIALDAQTASTVKGIIDKLQYENKNNKLGKRTAISALMTELFIAINRFVRANESAKSSNMESVVYDVTSYINAKYYNPITLEGLSDKFNISVYYLCKIFKASTGYTVVEYVNKVRIKNAMLILTKTSKSITEIAFDCGFNNSNHFTHTFRKLTGSTPSKYRKMNK